MHVASHISFSSKLLMKLQFELTLGTDFYLIWPAVRVPHHGRTASKKYITLHVRGLFCMADPGQSRSKASESGLECYLLKLQMLKMPRAWRPKVWLFIDWQLAKGSRKLALSPLCFPTKIKNNGPIGHFNYVSVPVLEWVLVLGGKLSADSYDLYAKCWGSCLAEFNFSRSGGSSCSSQLAILISSASDGFD